MKSILLATALGGTTIFTLSCQPNGEGKVPQQVENTSATTLRIKELISELLEVSPSQIQPGDSFIADLGADSLDFVELIMATEEEFGITIPDSDAVELTTVGALITYLKSPRT
ncbi:acyl carrier protein [Roseibacillus persicicus]|uniref:acyl carrier protein n=1 Tax=Roseibacillus persicicus TaxID=454148 RepID=UPI0031F30EC3